MRRTYRDVAMGPKDPEWRCDSCGLNNFASRDECRGCGPSAHRSSPGRQAASQGRGGGPAAAALQKEVAELRKQVAELKKKGTKDEEPADDASAGPSLDDLVKLHDMAVAALGKDSELAVMAKAKLDRARKQRDEAKPTSVRVRNLERLAEARKKAHAKAAEALDEARKVVEEAAKAHEETKQAWDEAERDLARLRDVQRGEAPAQPQPAAWEPSLPPNFGDMPEARRAKAKAAFDDLQKWVAENPPSSSPGSADGALAVVAAGAMAVDEAALKRQKRG